MSFPQSLVDRFGRLRARITPTAIAFALILLVGIFARTWQFGILPAALNEDEASTAVDAFDLAHYGVDRIGMSFPVVFTSWGNGQNALYAYVLIPFVSAGLTPVMVRLPMLVSSILTLPLLFVAARKLSGEIFGLVAMFFLAVSPWHIMLSRWALESNLLPFVFLLGFTALLYSTADNWWVVAACFFLGLSLYAYGTTYFAVPMFLVPSLVILGIYRRIRAWRLVIGLVVFAALAAPIALYVVINLLHLNSVQLGMITIPRVPGTSRFVDVAAIFHPELVEELRANSVTMAKLLVEQIDGLIWNAVPPYGYFYRYTFPLAVVGAFLLLPLRQQKTAPDRWLLFAWLGVSAALGVLQSANFNRVNLIFIPLILCTAALALWIHRHVRPLFVVGICALLVGFALFTRDYHGADYRRVADPAFFKGFLPALAFGTRSKAQPVCVTNQVNMPYIYVLFVDPMNPADYLGTIKYKDPTAMFRQVNALGRYSFGIGRCANRPGTIYVLGTEKPPGSAASYHAQKFEQYTVYTP
jgi:4-amino-4-deoxy-L-arabinose transferase-like glycosyltransferase